MLEKVAVQGFRAIGPSKLELDLAPLTILVGKNGVGKTAILEAVALTAQSAIEQPRLFDLVLTGTKVDLAQGAESDAELTARVSYCGDFRRAIIVALEVGVPLQPQSTRFPENAPEPFRWLDQWPPKRIRYEWRKTGTIGTLGTWTHEIHFDGLCVYSLSNTGAAGVQPPALLNLGRKQQSFDVQVLGPTQRVLSPGLFDFDVTRLEAQVRAAVVQVSEMLKIARTLLVDSLDRVSLLTPLRGAPLMHQDVGPEVHYVGPHGETTIRLLAGIEAKSNGRASRVTKWAERFGLPEMVASWAGGNQLKVVAKDPFNRAQIDIFQAASGARQGLTLAAQLLLSPKGSCLLVEEPENNMHPAFVRLLADLFAEAVEFGQQLVVTTHSELLIAAVGMAVRKKLISAPSVAIWHLDRDERGVHAKRVPISDLGYLLQVVDSWSEVERELFNEWQQDLPEARPTRSSGHPRSKRSGSTGRARDKRRRS